MGIIHFMVNNVLASDVLGVSGKEEYTILITRLSKNIDNTEYETMQ